MHIMNKNKPRVFRLKVKSLFYILIVGFLSSFLIIQLGMYVYTIKFLDFHVDELLIHAENIAINQIDAIGSAEKINSGECTHSDLKKLKMINFQSQYIRDVGKILHGKIICSALWEFEDTPYHLEGGRLTKNGFTIIDGFSGLNVNDEPIDITSIGSSFIVTSPEAFLPYQHITGLLLEITSRDGKYLIHSFGESIEGVVRLRCSNHFDFCIRGEKNPLLFNSNNKNHILMVLLLGLFISVSIMFIYDKYISINASLGKRLTRALKHKEIKVHYQPIFKIKDEVVLGFEALARWYDPIYGQVAPDLFIKESKRLNLYNTLNKHLLHVALSDFDSILKKRSDIYLSLNMDSHLLMNEDYLDYFLGLIKIKKINANQIAIEILESSTIELSTLSFLVKKLRKIGFKIFIDDFGTGYSNLSYLSSLEIDAVKIDRYFTQSAGTSSPTWLVLLKIIEITSSLQVMSIFEGIESFTQEYTILEHCSDPIGQGWLYSKAIPKENVVNFLENVRLKADAPTHVM